MTCAAEYSGKAGRPPRHAPLGWEGMATGRMVSTCNHCAPEARELRHHRDGDHRGPVRDHLGENDIARFEDVYGRVTEGSQREAL
jgi:hypothetical protein